MDLFDILDTKFDLKKQITGLAKLFFLEHVIVDGWNKFTFADYFDIVAFRNWDYNLGRLSVWELLEDLELLSEATPKSIKEIQTEDEAKILLQLCVNLWIYTGDHKQQFCSYNTQISKFLNIATNKVKYIFEKSNLRPVKHPEKDYYIITNRDEKIDAAAKKVNPDLAFMLYEYNSPNVKGNIKKKREILQQLSLEFEPIIKSKSHNSKTDFVYKVFDGLGTILNNFDIRHANSDNNNGSYYHPNLQNYTDTQWEEIYDVAFQLFLNVIFIMDFSNLSKIIDKHKSII